MVTTTSLPAPGDVLRDKYRLEAVLGEGGFGRVYRGTEVGTGRTIAVKVLKGGSQTKVAARFRREARAIAGLVCENTLTLFDYGEHNGSLFMVTEFIDGEDLVDRLSRGRPLDEGEVVHVLLQVLQSLREAHEHGVLHRDIKPANIRLYEYADDPLRVKVLDFGLAKAIDGNEVALTNTGAVVGTPRYMSPEQLIGEELTGATDIFSLGVVALEALLGPTHPLLSDIANRLTGLKIADDWDISSGLRTVVNRMLERDREARYRTAAEVLRDLHDLAGSRERVMQAAPPAQVRASEPPVSTQRGTPKPVPPREPTPPRDPIKRPNAVLGVALAVVALCLGLALLGDPAKPEPPPVRADISTLLTTQSVAAKAVSQHEPEAKAGCDLPFRGTGYVTEASRALDAERWYTYIPRDLDPRARHPLMVLLHQQGHTGEIFLDQGGFKPIADRHGVILVAPTESDFNAWAPQHLHVDGVVFMLEELSSQLCIDEDRIYGVGHAGGGGILPHLACRVPLAAFATHSMGMAIDGGACVAPQGTPYMMMYPLHSGYEPFGGGKTCSGATRASARYIEDFWLRKHQCERVETPSFTHGRSTCWEHQCELAPFQICHLDGGHGWTNTPVRPRQYRINDCDGPTPSFPMAERTWDFFSRVAPLDSTTNGSGPD